MSIIKAALKARAGPAKAGREAAGERPGPAAGSEQRVDEVEGNSDDAKLKMGKDPSIGGRGEVGEQAELATERSTSPAKSRPGSAGIEQQANKMEGNLDGADLESGTDPSTGGKGEVGERVELAAARSKSPRAKCRPGTAGADEMDENSDCAEPKGNRPSTARRGQFGERPELTPERSESPSESRPAEAGTNEQADEVEGNSDGAELKMGKDSSTGGWGQVRAEMAKARSESPAKSRPGPAGVEEQVDKVEGNSDGAELERGKDPSTAGRGEVGEQAELATVTCESPAKSRPGSAGADKIEESNCAEPERTRPSTARREQVEERAEQAKTRSESPAKSRPGSSPGTEEQANEVEGNFANACLARETTIH